MFYCPFSSPGQIGFSKGLLISCNDSVTTPLSSPIFHKGRDVYSRPHWENEVTTAEGNQGKEQMWGGGGVLMLLPLILWRSRWSNDCFFCVPLVPPSCLSTAGSLFIRNWLRSSSNGVRQWGRPWNVEIDSNKWCIERYSPPTPTSVLNIMMCTPHSAKTSSVIRTSHPPLIHMHGHKYFIDLCSGVKV